jgi:hypothetical protein
MGNPISYLPKAEAKNVSASASIMTPVGQGRENPLRPVVAVHPQRQVGAPHRFGVGMSIVISSVPAMEIRACRTASLPSGLIRVWSGPCP